MQDAPGIIAPMIQPPPETVVQPDAFRVSKDSTLLACELRAALAVCVYDDTQPAGVADDGAIWVTDDRAGVVLRIATD